jgi:Mn2+/Fe2+ NRAMP family transporter
MLIGIVGTTIAPWMQFYQQSAVVEKNIKVEHDWASGFDVISGFLMAVAVVFFIIVALRGNPFCQRNKDKRCPRCGHRARPPLAGQHASTLFAIGLGPMLPFFRPQFCH